MKNINFKTTIALVAILIASTEALASAKRTLSGFEGEERNYIAGSSRAAHESPLKKLTTTPTHENTKKAAPDLRAGTTMGDFAYLSKDITKMIFWMMDPESFSKMAQASKGVKKLTDDIRSHEFPHETLESMLRGGVTEDLLFRVVKPISGMNQLRDFFYSYFKRPKSERFIGRGENEFLFLFPQGLDDNEKLALYEKHAPVWQPYATAYAISRDFGRTNNYSLSSTLRSLLSDEEVDYPFYKTMNKVTIWDIDETNRQTDVLNENIFALAPHLFVNARNAQDIDFAHYQKRVMIEGLCNQSTEAFSHAQDATTPAEKYTYYKKEAGYHEVSLELLGDQAKALGYRAAAVANLYAGNNAETPAEKYVHYKKEEEHREKILELLGDDLTPDDYGEAAVATFNAAKNTETAAEKVVFYKKAAGYFEKVLELKGVQASAQEYGVSANTNFQAAINAETPAEKVELFKKAAGYCEKLLKLKGDQVTAQEYGSAAKSNFYAATNAETPAEKDHYLNRANELKEIATKND